MKRGVIGSLNLYSWLDDIRNGNQNALGRHDPAAERGPHRRGADLEAAAARGSSSTSAGPFNAKGTDVAMEELTLAYERLEME